MWDKDAENVDGHEFAPRVHDQEVTGYGSTAHAQDGSGQSTTQYTQLSDMTAEGNTAKRPLVRFLAAGMLVACVVLLIFFVASGALGRWFGADQCYGTQDECDLRTVVNSFCPAPIACTTTEDCPAGKQCFDEKTNALGIECKAGECFCQQDTCAVSADGTRVDLGGIKLGAEGGKRLAKPLKWDTKLQQVHLWSTGVGDEGGAAIADAVKTHGAITMLNLAGNGITDASAAKFGSLIATNGQITHLNLSGNEIGNNGAKALADGLKSNTALLELNLWENNISEQGALFLAQAFDYNKNLRRLYLTDNQIDAGDVGSTALKAATDTRTEEEAPLEITFERND